MVITNISYIMRTYAKETPTIISGPQAPAFQSKWKKKALEELPDIFAGSGRVTRLNAADEKLVSRLYEEIGRLKVEVDWLKKKLEVCR